MADRICKADFPDIDIRKVDISDPQFETDGVRHLTVCSDVVGGRADISFWMPSVASGLSNVPIVLLLHGVYGSHWSWFFQGGAHRVADEAIRSGEIRPMVLACPSDGLRGEGTGYLPVYGQDFEAWIASVPRLLISFLPCCSAQSPVFIGGLSMGGYGALRLGSRFPRIFSGVSAHSPITEVEEFSSFISEPAVILAADRLNSSILHWIDTNRTELPPLRFDCGSEDSLLADCESFHQELSRRGVVHEYEVLPGSHNWLYWHDNLGRSLSFFDSLLD